MCDLWGDSPFQWDNIRTLKQNGSGTGIVETSPPPPKPHSQHRNQLNERICVFPEGLNYPKVQPNFGIVDCHCLLFKRSCSMTGL